MLSTEKGNVHLQLQRAGAPNQVLTHAARAAASQGRRHLWWPRAKGSGRVRVKGEPAVQGEPAVHVQHAVRGDAGFYMALDDAIFEKRGRVAHALTRALRARGHQRWLKSLFSCLAAARAACVSTWLGEGARDAGCALRAKRY